jgi:hypothetical protein
MSDVEKLVAAILAAALSAKGEIPSNVKDYVDTYENVLAVLKQRQSESENAKRAAASKDDSWTAVNAELKRKKNAEAPRS